MLTQEQRAAGEPEGCASAAAAQLRADLRVCGVPAPAVVGHAAGGACALRMGGPSAAPLHSVCVFVCVLARCCV